MILEIDDGFLRLEDINPRVSSILDLNGELGREVEELYNLCKVVFLEGVLYRQMVIKVYLIFHSLKVVGTFHSSKHKSLK